VGAWRTLRVDSTRPPGVACRLCGRPLFGRVWSADAGGEAAEFCDEECETLYRDYWLPRYDDPER
jgi:hypothetical protein